ncbi:MAG: hypothetical protein ACSHW0_03110 [Thalassotalea sp.]
MTPQFYNTNALELSQQYLSKSFEQVHKSWSHFLPAIFNNPHARILDLGAGAGRDAKYFTAPVEKPPKKHVEQTQLKRFFAEANIALPGLNSNNDSIDDLFEALVMQLGRLKEMQQLREW